MQSLAAFARTLSPRRLAAVRPTLAQKLLAAVLALSVATVAAMFVFSFDAFRERFETQKIADLQLYAQERTRTEQRLFNDLRAKENAATVSLQRRLATVSQPLVDRDFDRIFPLAADGTRRSTPQAFDGLPDGAGGLIYGLAGFMSDGANIGPDERAVLHMAARVALASGQSDPEKFDNFYFFTPTDRMVIFAPRRPDRLMYYRHDAPASFSFRGEDMVRIMSPEANPRRQMRCDKLRALLSDPTKQRLTTACYTPVYLDGRFVGAWGITLDISSYLMRAVNDAPPGATSLIVSADGDLIAYPGFRDPGRITADAVARYERELKLDPLIALIRAQHDTHGVITSPDGTKLVAYGRLGGPDWYFLITMPKAQIAREAAAAAFKILAVGGVVLLIQMGLVLYLVRRLVTAPLTRLARHSKDASRGDSAAEAIDDLEARRDEIGTLARTLAKERARGLEILGTLEQRVRDRTADLERANEAKASFLANMSHELRTPLNGVVALSDLLKDRQTDPENREMASLIVSSGRLLEQVVNDILDMSKIEAGRMTLETAPFDLATSLRRICELHAAAAAAKGIALRWEVAPAAEGVYEGDAVRLTQILSNLLSNAVKFTEKGGVTLKASPAEGGLRLDVSDTGIGFDEDTAQRLFRRFEQADASMTRRFGGTGLGLSICRSLSEMMGGRIDVTSTPAVGSTFSLWLPLAAVAEASAEEDVAPAAESDGFRARVLLAEDHPTNQRVVALVLEPLGVDLVIVGDGAQALDRAIEGGFDVILMDVQMPEMDGLTATRLIRAHEAEMDLPRVPIVSLTANALGEHVVASLEAGADLHLAKPIRPDALIATVMDLATRGAAPAETAAA